VRFSENSSTNTFFYIITSSVIHSVSSTWPDPVTSLKTCSSTSSLPAHHLACNHNMALKSQSWWHKASDSRPVWGNHGVRSLMMKDKKRINHWQHQKNLWIMKRDKMPMPLHSDSFILSPMQQIMKTIPNKILNNMITVQILDVTVALGCLTHCSSLPTKALLSVLFPLSFSLPASVLLHVPKQFHYHIHHVLVWHKYSSRWKSFMMWHHVAWYPSTILHGFTTHKTVCNLYTHHHVNFKFHIICTRGGSERRKRLDHVLFDGKVILKRKNVPDGFSLW